VLLLPPLVLELSKLCLRLLTKADPKGVIQAPVRSPSSADIVICGCNFGLVDPGMLLPLVVEELILLLPLDSLVVEPPLGLVIKEDSEHGIQSSGCPPTSREVLVLHGSSFG
jgi:hypothetical protein